MAEYAYNPVQTVQPNQAVLLDTVIPCNKRFVYHRDQSGILTLKGAVNNPCANFARYQVAFNGNIAVPTGTTVGPISLSLAISGEPIATSRAIVTPAAVEQYFNVTSTAIITVPKGCCFNVSVENTSESATPATTPAPAVNVQNANLTVTRIA